MAIELPVAEEGTILMRRLILIVVSLLVSGIFLWLSLQGVPLAAVVENIGQANPFWIIVSFALVGVGLWIRGARWSGLLDNRIPVMKGFYLFSITMMINLLPLRAGELVRSLLATRYGVPIVTAAASIVVERLIDVIAVVIILAIGLAQLPTIPAVVANTAAVFAIAAVVVFVALILLARFPETARNLMSGIEARIPIFARLGLRKRLEEVLDGLRPMTHWRSAAQAIMWTVLGWGLSLVTFYCVELAFGVQGVNVWLMSALSITLASFGAAIPVTVASIGPVQGAVRVSGEMIGMNAIIAASLGIVFHGITSLGYAVFGVIGLFSLGLSFGDLVKRVEAEGQVVAEAEQSLNS
jgi:uncharacterized membrane protein YbhN (UPF0104 family)